MKAQPVDPVDVWIPGVMPLAPSCSRQGDVRSLVLALGECCKSPMQGSSLEVEARMCGGPSAQTLRSFFRSSLELVWR